MGRGAWRPAGSRSSARRRGRLLRLGGGRGGLADPDPRREIAVVFRLELRGGFLGGLALGLLALRRFDAGLAAEFGGEEGGLDLAAAAVAVVVELGVLGG